jgi:hypothetical protein
MALPDSIQTVTLTGHYTHPDGTPMRGSVQVKPTSGRIVSATTGLSVQGPARHNLDENGDVTITVVASDATGINPTGGTYDIRITFYDAPGDDFAALLPAVAPDVSLPAITPITPADGHYVIVTGPPGPAGPQGPSGASGGTYLHTQASPAATWQINHSLGRTPNIAVINTSGTVVHADIVHNSASQAVVTFPAPYAGTAFCS